MNSQERTLKTGRNVIIANCIFTPTIFTAIYFMAFLYWCPRSWPAEKIYSVGGGGSLMAALIGWGIAYPLRYSERLNWVIRWLMMLLMGSLIVFAIYFTIRDLKMFFG